MELKNKTVIVTGGVSGIGRKVTEALLDQECKVCLVDVNDTLGKQAIQELGEKFGDPARILFVNADVSDIESFDKAFQKTLNTFGSIDIVINNAGIHGAEPKKVIAVNLVGVVNGSDLAVRYMGTNNGGQGGVIINTASIAGICPCSTGPVYTATKFGVVGFTKAFGKPRNFAQHGIRMGAVCPWFTETPMTESVKYIDDMLSASFVAEGFLQLIREGKNGDILGIMSEKEGFQLVDLDRPNLQWSSRVREVFDE